LRFLGAAHRAVFSNASMRRIRILVDDGMLIVFTC
jgi:hypothetical protein